VRLTPEEVVALDYYDPKRAHEYGRLIERELAAPIVETPDDDHRYFCGGGMNGCAIDPTGEMSICVISHQQDYNIRSKGFLEGWEGPLLEIRNQPRTRPTICDRCKIRSICGMCPANGELENGDAESPVDFLCRVAHLRAYALGFEVPEHGDCSCCAPGSVHDELMASAARVKQQETDPSLWAGGKTPPAALNILQPSDGCASGGCGSCASHHA
jgi:radical SAM protein with 4Fe4S-binding SPASM domain